MNAIPIAEKLLIDAASKGHDYLFNGDRTALATANKKRFYATFSKIMQERHNIKISAIEAQARFKNIRDSCVKADAMKRKNQRVPAGKELYYNACPFLHPFMKHSNDGYQSGSETSEISRSATPVSVQHSVSGIVNHSPPQNQHRSSESDVTLKEAIAHQADLERLAAEALATRHKTPSGGTKRNSLDNMQNDFPKKTRTEKNHVQEEDAHLQVLTDRMAQLLKQNDALIKAKARAKLISKCIEELPMQKQVKCIPKVLAILKKYEKQN